MLEDSRCVCKQRLQIRDKGNMPGSKIAGLFHIYSIKISHSKKKKSFQNVLDINLIFETKKQNMLIRSTEKSSWRRKKSIGTFCPILSCFIWCYEVAMMLLCSRWVSLQSRQMHFPGKNNMWEITHGHTSHCWISGATLHSGILSVNTM